MRARPPIRVTSRSIGNTYIKKKSLFQLGVKSEIREKNFEPVLSLSHSPRSRAILPGVFEDFG